MNESQTGSTPEETEAYEFPSMAVLKGCTSEAARAGIRRREPGQSQPELSRGRERLHAAREGDGTNSRQRKGALHRADLDQLLGDGALSPRSAG
jgi:hypothetical protein